MEHKEFHTSRPRGTRSPGCGKEKYLLWMSGALDGALSPRQREALDRHLAACPACRAAFSAMEEQARALRDWQPLPPAGLLERVTNPLPETNMEIISSRQDREDSPAAVLKAPPRASRRWLAGLAACLAVTGFCLARFSPGPSPSADGAPDLRSAEGYPTAQSDPIPEDSPAIQAYSENSYAETAGAALPQVEGAETALVLSAAPDGWSELPVSEDTVVDNGVEYAYCLVDGEGLSQLCAWAEDTGTPWTYNACAPMEDIEEPAVQKSAAVGKEDAGGGPEDTDVPEASQYNTLTASPVPEGVQYAVFWKLD